MDATQLIKDAREHRGMTQQAAANQAGMTVQHWGQIERGKERGKDETVAKMAQIVGVTPTQLENAGRDLAADRLRELLSPVGQAATGETTGGLNDVLVLTGIMRKLTPEETAWLFANVDLLAMLAQREHSA